MRLLPLLLLLACRQTETTIAQIPGSITVIPAITDMGNVAVGDAQPFRLQLDHVMGPEVRIIGVDVFNLEGAHFEQVGELPVIPIGGTEFLDLEYAPQDGGYHRAIVTVYSDAERTPEIGVEVRGHGVPADVQRWPGLLDFGPVLPPAVVVRTISVGNFGFDDQEITGAAFSRPDLFTVDTPLPLALPHGTVVELDVSFHPADATGVFTAVAIELGPLYTLADVGLRANDCALGDPRLFDGDGDGWTACGGDCDDGDGLAFPGASEVADGADQDCDGTSDEGTSGYDDDGDCACEGSACAGSINGGCATLAPGDCNDGDGEAYPAASETIGNGVDDDCDGVVDQGTTDSDSDGYSPGGGDCNDADPSIRPGATELPDGLDNDCDGADDDGTVRFDDDGDGYCETGPCTDASIAGDCDDNPDDNDTDADLVADGFDTHPLAPELPDGRDNNCDALGPGGSNRVDEGTTRYDDDGDGFTEDGGDCDDADPLASPGRTEVRFNGRDDDCNISTVD